MTESRLEMNEWNCCTMKSMCGRSLAEGVFIVGWSSVGISSAMLLVSVLYLFINSNRASLDPVMGIMTISSMTIICMSSYQIVISILMIWQRMQKQPKPFFYSIWYVSHLSIITLYTMMALAIVMVHVTNDEVAMGLLYLFYSCVYLGILIYFEIVINSHLNSGNIGERFI